MSELGSDTASVLRIITHVDRLVEAGANADALVRSAARLAQCPVTAIGPDGPLRYDALGGPLPVREHPAAPVLVERDGPPHPLDPLLADRVRHALAVASAAVLPPPRLGDPGLLEVVLSARHGVEERTRALRLLGLDPSRPLRVLAVAGPGEGPDPAANDLVRAALPPGALHVAPFGSVAALALQSPESTPVCAAELHRRIERRYPATTLTPDSNGPWVGIGTRVSPMAAHASWEQARRALRFASSTTYGRRAIAFDRIGTLATVADLPLDRLRADPDVRAIDGLTATESGRVDVATFEAFCMYGSLRRTATELHVHHTTVAARLARVERAMGWHLDDPLDRFKAMLTLMVRRIALSSTDLAAGGTDIRRADPPETPTPVC
jgi:hypothetical protein